MRCLFFTFLVLKTVSVFARMVKSHLGERKLWFNILIRVSENEVGMFDNFETGDSWPFYVFLICDVRVSRIHNL